MKEEVVLRWLKKAEKDLKTVKHLLILEDAPTDVIAFHCQQAVEKTISAFANSKGGKIFVGIEENKNGSVKEIVGIRISGKEIENLSKDIKQNTDPVIFPSIEIEKIKDNDVIMLEIQENPIKPVFVKGREVHYTIK